MSYFTHSDHEQIIFSTDRANCGGVYEKFMNLHLSLRDKFRMNDWDLHAHPVKSQVVSTTSATATIAPEKALVLSYFRSYEQARLVEGQMGIEITAGEQSIVAARHPVIELRLTPEHVAIELVVSPLAWWDQVNFVSKIDLQRHRESLRRLLYRTEADYRFGFWGGEHLSEMHLTTWQLLHGRVMDEWMDTFADGQDWLRLGVWYDVEDARLSSDFIVQEATTRIGELYRLYDFLLWTSNNDYHKFYQKREKFARRMYA